DHAANGTAGGSGSAGTNGTAASQNLSGSESAAPMPDAPTISAISPSGPSKATHPKLTGSAPLDTTVAVFSNSGCSGTPLAQGSWEQFESTGIPVPVPTEATTTLFAHTHDAAGDSPCSTTS